MVVQTVRDRVVFASNTARIRAVAALPRRSLSSSKGVYPVLLAATTPLHGPRGRPIGTVRPDFGRLLLAISAAMKSHRPDILVFTAGIAVALALSALALNLYEPMFTRVRDWLQPALLASGLALAFGLSRRQPGGGKPPPRWLAHLKIAGIAAALLSAGLSTAVEARFRSIRAEVLAADPGELARLGRHIMIGTDEPAELRKLIELRAVGGIFVSWRSAKGKTQKQLGEMISKLDALHRTHSGTGLWVAADQEGGVVQRLSPPLPRQTSLPGIVAKHKDLVDREAAVRKFATAQGRALAGVGVNVNFAPVVDISTDNRKRRDGYTRLARRAIAADPESVATTARWYCEELWAAGVRCTRKHFPGLGRVFTDTHVREAMLNSPVDLLVKSDWVPFESAGRERPDWVMVGHTRVAALDPETPASASQPVIAKLRSLGHSGIVITDDFSMGAIKKNRLGIGGAAISALNAGVDVVLISYDADQTYLALHALLKASRDGRLDSSKLDESAVRLEKAAGLIPNRP